VDVEACCRPAETAEALVGLSIPRIVRHDPKTDGGFAALGINRCYLSILATTPKTSEFQPFLTTEVSEDLNNL
jgi:hypothetical protein